MEQTNSVDISWEKLGVLMEQNVGNYLNLNKIFYWIQIFTKLTNKINPKKSLTNLDILMFYTNPQSSTSNNLS